MINGCGISYYTYILIAAVFYIFSIRLAVALSAVCVVYCAQWEVCQFGGIFF